MQRWSWWLVLVLFCCGHASSARGTYSIVARDPASGEIGVAVQTHWFNVGTLVAWAEAGVGGVATQSLVDVSYGPLGLELMRAGRNADATLRALLEADASPQIRQVGIVDASGVVATHTGDGCIPHAGHLTGEQFTVQANLMARGTVPAAMARAFENATGPLAERMIAALRAAEAEGGDIRGKQSAALIVVSGTNTGRPWIDRLIDLRVDDHHDPVEELARLLQVHRGYAKMNEGDLAIEHGDHAAAEAAYGAAQDILGDNLEARYWYAVALCNAGAHDRAITIFHDVFTRGPQWAELTPRLVENGMLQAEGDVLTRILGRR
jgi:uncharacterized Ntn-hydrolase superfamily protein